MDTENEVVTKEEEIETAVENEESEHPASGVTLITALGFGLGVLAGVLLDKYAVKPIMNAVKAVRNRHKEITLKNTDDEESAEIDEYDNPESSDNA